MEIYLFAIIILVGLAIFDLIIGVSNDAVNFLNSSTGSRVAPRYVIMIIASLGMLAGVTFSSGMMEVARKGIFHPEYFLMTELIAIFLAVMLTDIILLDLFNTFGLPTSTTVSIVFELLGAAVAISLIKIIEAGDSFTTLVSYINTGKALAIISGILLSVVIAFICGAVVQFISRLIFSFDYRPKLKRYGGVWGGLSLSIITYFILIKGAKGTSFLTPETVSWIKDNAFLIMAGCFVAFGLIFQFIAVFTRINILKPIVLIGTFALAMAFAANDLVNFIGVPLAGMEAYNVASASPDPMNITMSALDKKVQSNTVILLIAGMIMVVTLWISKKARTVTKTEVGLSRQDDGAERFGSFPLSRGIVGMVSSFLDISNKIIPPGMKQAIGKRMDASRYNPLPAKDGELPAFDLLRASVNLMVAGAVVSVATSMKLPLSTTYVTFMVAMGTSLSDQAWGKESAVYRVTGVLTVIGGWFCTAFIAFTVSLIFATVIYYLKIYAIIGLVLFALFVIWKSFRYHKSREYEADGFNALNIKDNISTEYAINISFEQTGYFLNEISNSLRTCFDSVFSNDRNRLHEIKNETKKIQLWANIIIANVFKTLYLLGKEDNKNTRRYSSTVSALQQIVECHRDIVLRSYHHVINYHSELLDSQKDELIHIRLTICRLLENTAIMLLKRKKVDYEYIDTQCRRLRELILELDKKQVVRIQNAESKTRLSILFYGYLENSEKISIYAGKLLDIYRECFILENKKY